MPTVGPKFPIRVKDAVAQKRSKCALPISEAEIFELCTENSLNVLWFTCGNNRYGHDPAPKSIPELLESVPVLLKSDLVLAIVYLGPKNVKAEERFFVEYAGTGLTVVLFDEALARKV